MWSFVDKCQLSGIQLKETVAFKNIFQWAPKTKLDYAGQTEINPLKFIHLGSLDLCFHL